VGDATAIHQQLADPRIRIASLTVTEGAISSIPPPAFSTQAHPEIAADAASPEAPRTVFGLILAGLKERAARDLRPSR
jgi:mannitol 2-dehydrogenase